MKAFALVARSSESSHLQEQVSITSAGNILRRSQLALSWAALGDSTMRLITFCHTHNATNVPVLAQAGSSAMLQQSGEQASQHTHRLRQTQSVLLRLALTTAEEKLSKVIGPL